MSLSATVILCWILVAAAVTRLAPRALIQLGLLTLGTFAGLAAGSLLIDLAILLGLPVGPEAAPFLTPAGVLLTLMGAFWGLRRLGQVPSPLLAISGSWLALEFAGALLNPERLPDAAQYVQSGALAVMGLAGLTAGLLRWRGQARRVTQAP